MGKKKMKEFDDQIECNFQTLRPNTQVNARRRINRKQDTGSKNMQSEAKETKGKGGKQWSAGNTKPEQGYKNYNIAIRRPALRLAPEFSETNGAKG
jgi:hypothetical protein